MSGSSTLVSSFGSLNAAIEAVDAASTSGAYTITIGGAITETADLAAINLHSGVSLVIEGTLGGALNGNNAHRGLFVYQGDVTVENLTIENAKAVGGAGGSGGGGGGAGLGGGLFVAGTGATGDGTGGNVTLASVTFTNDSAVGGAGGIGLGGTGGLYSDGGGGGGLGGAGGGGFRTDPGGGGGIGSQAAGGSHSHTGGGDGIVSGAAAGGGTNEGGVGGLNGGGGAGISTGVTQPAGGGGVGGVTGARLEGGTGQGSGGTGGFGGGGGGGTDGGGAGGFGGGGGGGGTYGRTGGFGGGGAGGSSGAAGGFGAGSGGSHGGGGGGGLGAGGDIFVQQGGSLVIEGGTLGPGAIAAGAAGGGGGGGAGTGGSSYGSVMFLQGLQSQTLAPASGATLTIAGGIADESGSASGFTADKGSIVINGAGTVDLTAPSTYTGGTTIDEGALILGAAGAAGTGGITFGSGDPPLLEFSLAAAPTNVISGFTIGETIDITDLTLASITSTSLNTSTDVLTIDYHNGAAVDALHLTFSGAYTSGAFHTIYDGATGTDLLLCYLRGTCILTPTGEAKVETLGIGGSVVTRFGGIRKIKWIGRQSYEAALAPHKIPVRIRAGALGDNIPARDLYISPGHSMLLEDTLVLATALLNGITITQEMPENTPQIEYYQIELESHDCIIAEGAWSETFGDGPGLREAFDNAADYYTLYPDEPPPEALNLCAPRPESGAKLEAALRPVMARAAKAVPPGRLEGYVERASTWKIEGWAVDHANPSLPVLLDICIQNRVIGTVLARNHRADLGAAGKGTGRCAFTFTAPERLRPETLQTLRIRRAADGADLQLSRKILAILPATTEPPRLRAVA